MTSVFPSLARSCTLVVAGLVIASACLAFIGTAGEDNRELSLQQNPSYLPPWIDGRDPTEALFLNPAGLSESGTLIHAANDHSMWERLPNGQERGQTSPESLDCIPHPPIQVTEEEGPNGFILAHHPLTGAPIYRPGSGVTSGSGIPEDPYVIEGWCLAPPPACSSCPIGVHISGTDSHTLVLGNVIEQFIWSGVELEQANHVTLRDNLIRYNGNGINALDLDGLTVKENEILNVGASELYLENTQRTRIFDNEITHQPAPPPGPLRAPADEHTELYPYAGIRGVGNHDLVIARNQIDDDLFSVRVFLVDSHGLQVTDNRFAGLGTGIHLRNGGEQEIASNRFDGNPIGIKIDSSEGAPSSPSVSIKNNVLETDSFAGNPLEGPAIGILSGYALVEENNLVGKSPSINLNGVDGAIVMANRIDARLQGFDPVLHHDRAFTDNHIETPSGLIILSRSSNVTIQHNELTGGTLMLRGTGMHHYEHIIDETNTIDDRPILYVRGNDDVVISRDDVAQIILVDSHRITIRDVSIIGPVAPIQVLGSDDVVIENTVLKENTIGIYAADSDRLRVHANEIEGSWLGINIVRTTGAEVSGNKLHGGGDGMIFRESVGATIRNNQVTGMEWSGVSLFESGGSTVEHNDLTDNLRGILLTDSRGMTFQYNELAGNGYGLVEVAGDLGDGGGHVLSHNNINTNSEAGVHAETDHTLDARENWWGCSGGPGESGCDTVSGGVDYSDWLTSRVPDAGA